ncbi:MAG: hypothetical protein ACR2OX_01300, partial [Methyloligellaceae bacterium]
SPERKLLKRFFFWLHVEGWQLVADDCLCLDHIERQLRVIFRHLEDQNLESANRPIADVSPNSTACPLIAISGQISTSASTGNRD